MRNFFIMMTFLSVIVACESSKTVSSSDGSGGSPPAPSNNKSAEAKIQGKWSSGMCTPVDRDTFQRQEARIGHDGYGYIWLGMQTYYDSACSREKGMLSNYKATFENGQIIYWLSYEEWKKQKLTVDYIDSNHIRLNGLDYYKYQDQFP